MRILNLSITPVETLHPVIEHLKEVREMKFISMLQVMHTDHPNTYQVSANFVARRVSATQIKAVQAYLAAIKDIENLKRDGLYISFIIKYIPFQTRYGAIANPFSSTNPNSYWKKVRIQDLL